MNAMKLKRSHVEGRAAERGYALDWISPCFLEDLGEGWWLVDVDHERYPRKREAAPVMPLPEGGPGTELKAILRKVGISSSPNCSCNAKARLMDVMEANAPGWCQENIDSIVGWLEAEARRRKLPFLRFGAKKLVEMAISKSRKKATRG